MTVAPLDIVNGFFSQLDRLAEVRDGRIKSAPRVLAQAPKVGYLGKIVQMEFDLPREQRDRLREVCDGLVMLARPTISDATGEIAVIELRVINARLWTALDRRGEVVDRLLVVPYFRVARAA